MRKVDLEIHVKASADLSAQARDEILALCERAYGERRRRRDGGLGGSPNASLIACTSRADGA